LESQLNLNFPTDYKNHLLTHLTQKKLFEFSLIKKTILDIHNRSIKIHFYQADIPSLTAGSVPNAVSSASGELYI
jgi:hypothetical protein